MTTTVAPELKKLALDLTKKYPRSPRAMLGGFVIAARALDKCRADLNGTVGEYNYNCPLDRFFFDFAQIDSDAFSAFVATGANDEAVDAWIRENSKVTDKLAIAKFNNSWRCKLLTEVSDEYQVFMEEIIAEHAANNRVIFMFDVIDAEEGRLNYSLL